MAAKKLAGGSTIEQAQPGRQLREKANCHRGGRAATAFLPSRGLHQCFVKRNPLAIPYVVVHDLPKTATFRSHVSRSYGQVEKTANLKGHLDNHCS